MTRRARGLITRRSPRTCRNSILAGSEEDTIAQGDNNGAPSGEAALGIDALLGAQAALVREDVEHDLLASLHLHALLDVLDVDIDLAVMLVGGLVLHRVLRLDPSVLSLPLDHLAQDKVGGNPLTRQVRARRALVLLVSLALALPLALTLYLVLALTLTRLRLLLIDLSILRLCRGH